jgi:galactofuranosylgalactofuranosylrhamnosyl-N-acetylglucosaminyl-diphospho-decaprenol beta-1,5/1,6-galactofuranosyltransferase
MQFDHGPVQRTMFGPPRDLEPATLYHRVELGVAVAERDGVRVEPHARVSTNTYFGRFPASYWQRWTRAGRVRVEADVDGGGTVRLVASDFDGKPRTVDSVQVEPDRAGTIALHAELTRFVDGGALWLEVITTERPLHVGQVRWLVDVPPRERGAAVVICTFNRADDCLRTLRALTADDHCTEVAGTVYVVDQGTDVVASRAGFAEVEKALGDRLRYVVQPNLGGAGGFTRGIFEVVREGGTPANIVLMDDDIVLEPETVPRLVAFADRTERPAVIGGQMLRLLHPEELHVGAEQTHLPRLRAGLPVTDALHSADMTEDQQDLRVDAEYNAWWMCLIPPEVVAAIGYPLPLFFQWDDIEYGLRAGAAGFPTVTLPGAGVWHADFGWKDWDDWPRYFSLRNSLVVSALHGEFNLPQTARWLSGQLVTYLVSMRYGLAATLITAVEDFLAGPAVLTDGGAEAATRIRKLRAEYPETVVHPAHGADSVPIAAAGPDPSWPIPVLLKRLLWHVTGVSRGKAAVRAADGQWWHTSLFDSVVVTDPSQSGVKIRKRDRALFRGLLFRGVRVLRRLVREGRAVRRDYRAAMPQLTSEANWARLFGVADRSGAQR